MIILADQLICLRCMSYVGVEVCAEFSPHIYAGTYLPTGTYIPT